MRYVFWAAFWSFLADQASKYLVLHTLDLRRIGAIDVWPPFLNFRMAWNDGINFGLFGDGSDAMRWILIAVALVVVAGVLIWLRRDPPATHGMIAGGLLVGGALGNVVDRVLYGAVADFLNMSCCGINNPFAFNIADVAVFVGAMGLVFFPGTKNAA